MSLPRPADIGAVLAELGISAKQHEGEWSAKCPAHSPDRNPSWTIVDEPGSTRHGLHLCRSCQFNGTLLKLVMHVRGFASWASAYELLERFPATTKSLPRIRVGSGDSRGFRMPSEIEWRPFANWPSPFKRYATRRGLTEQQIDRWRIGFAIGGTLDGRIVFAIESASGKIGSYQARLVEGLGNGPRYLTPKEEQRPDQDLVFGERYWPEPSARRAARIVVWEGAIKALAFERAVPGESFAVLGGSKIRAAHAGKLAQFGEVLVATDSNQAGNDAAAKLAAVLGRHVLVKRVILPRDPDELTPEEVRSFFPCLPQSIGSTL
jgi:hypothetical protein